VDKPKHYEFSVGDMVIDKTTNSVGLLIERYDIFAGYFEDLVLNDFSDLGEDEEDLFGAIGAIWAWEILWTGSAESDKKDRYHSYTEVGLSTLVREGYFKLVKKRDDDKE